ncbi:hypothetical protein BJF79_28655 [Actinomadura sp. CNU-125]|uniref:hypothetical protein n=1 Tax=Actinomadura sp. CNU-125 TaxID=1904961 RepID=UPI0009689BCC|nr:hypothetical protein [Actinomadura sp. CNU-125]OLT37872.1 hypothetical protein BJF79_28655 [Actinomadura sp. CNU-125]
MRRTRIAAGVLLACIAGAALWNPFRWIGMDGLYWLWTSMLVVGIVVLAIASARKNALGAIGSFLLALMAIIVVHLAVLAAVFDEPGARATRVVDVSADGRFRLVVHDTSNIIDPVTALYIERGRGFFAKRTFLGCDNLDTGGGATIEPARFAGPDTVVVGNGRRTLTFDPHDVRAIDTLPADTCGPRLYTG